MLKKLKYAEDQSKTFDISSKWKSFEVANGKKMRGHHIQMNKRRKRPRIEESHGTSV